MRKNCRWRDQFGPSETIQRVRPKESRAYLANPHRGTATFQRFNGDPVRQDWRWDDRDGPLSFAPYAGDPAALRNERYPCTTMAYCRWIWADIEPCRGQIRWDVFDGALAAAASRGQTLQMRLQPFIGNDTPAWYWATGAAADPERAKDNQHHPDHNDPRYLEHWGAIIRALGARYDGHPALESFDIAYGGPCGEVGGNCTPETTRRLVDVYLDAFRKTTLLSLLGTDGCAYGATRRDRALGWRADCFGDLRDEGRGAVPDGLCWNHTYDAYPMEVARNGVGDVWRTAPVTFETCWSVPWWYERNWDIDFIIEQGLKYHPTVFMPKSCHFPEAWREKLDAFDRRLGYRFVLRQVSLPIEIKPGSGFEIQALVDNVGVAPIYRDYRFALRFVQDGVERVVESAQDIRRWVPDLTWFREPFAFPAGFRAGEVEIFAGIINPATRRPVVRFAIEETEPDGWHPLTRLEVVT